jgi:E3 ubiquitin-protein ligase HUWE1
LCKAIDEVDFITNICRLCFERVPDNFCTKLPNLFGRMSTLTSRFPRACAEAFHDMFIRPASADFMSILRTNPAKPRKAPEVVLRSLEELLALIDEKPSPRAVHLIRLFAALTPTAFLETPTPPATVARKLLRVGARLMAEREQGKLAAGLVLVVSALSHLLEQPSVADEMMPALLDFGSMPFESAILSVVVLRSVFHVETRQFGLNAWLIRGRFLETAEGEVRRATEDGGVVALAYATQLGYLSAAFVAFVGQLQDQFAPCFDELVQSAHPFSLLFPGTIGSFHIPGDASPLRFIAELLPELDPRRLSEPFEPVRDLTGGAPSDMPKVLRELSEVPAPVSRWDAELLPETVPAEIFAHLPETLQATVLWHGLPGFPQAITPGRGRVLVRHAAWVTDVMRARSSLLLPVEHLLELHEAVKDFGKVPEKEITAAEVCARDVNVEVVPGLLSNKRSPAVAALMTALARAPALADGAIEGIRAMIAACEVKGLAQFLQGLGPSPEFSALLCERLREPLLEMLLSVPMVKVSEPSWVSVAELFSASPPAELAAPLLFAFLERHALDALHLYSLVPASAREGDAVFVEGQFGEGANPRLLQPLLKAFPGVVVTRRAQLLGMASRVMGADAERVDDQTALSLLEALSPKEGEAMPEDYLQLTKAHPAVIERLMRDGKLRFLEKWPQAISLTGRIALFHGRQREKLTAAPIPLVVRRSDIVMDSFERLRPVKGKALLGPIRVRFVDEPGIDAGGVRRDWFTNLARALFDPNLALFQPSANGRSCQPSPVSYQEPRHLQLFEFAGRVIARALSEGQTLDTHLSLAFLKHLLGVPVTLRDLEDVDEDVYRNLLWVLEATESQLEEVYMDFSVDWDNLGVKMNVALKPGGIDEAVTASNKAEYVELRVAFRLGGQIGPQLEAFKRGFYELVSLEEIRQFTPEELDLLICGLPDVDVDDFIENCELLHPLTRESPVVRRFFEAVRTFSAEQKGKLLMFMTGSSQVPVGGFRALSRAGMAVKLGPGGPTSRLPSAHTCWSQLDLPEYESVDELRTKLLFAIENCNQFGFG